MSDDLISRRVAIDALWAERMKHSEEMERNLETCSFALRADNKARRNRVEEDIEVIKQLPPAQPENADCIYCHEDSDGYVKPIEKNCHAFIRFGMNGWEISLSAKGWNGSAKIMYCPMCGRKLKNDK